MALQPVGAELILAGVPSFVSGANAATNAINNFATRIDNTGQTFQKLGQRVTEAGNFLQRTGFILSFQLTAPLVALGKAVFNASTDFETAFSEIRKNVNDAAEDDFPRIEQALIELSKQTGISAIDLATIAGQAGQVGISAAHIIPFTTEIAKLQVATNLGADATQDFARIANLAGTTDFPALSSAITFAGATTNATEKEIVSMAVQLAGMRAIINLTAPDIIGLSAGWSSLGIRAEHARGAFQKLGFTISDAIADRGSKELELFANISGQTSDAFAIQWETKPIDAILGFINGLGTLSDEGRSVADTIINNLGVSAEEFGNLLETDSNAAVAMYNKALRDSGSEAVELDKTLVALGFNEIRIRDLLLRSAVGHDLVTKAVNDTAKAYRDKDRTDKEFEERLKTTQNQLDRMKAEVVAAAIEIGKLITPDVLEAAKELTRLIVDLAKAFVSLDPGTRKFLLVSLAITAAIAPLAVIIGAVVSLLGLMVQGYGLLSRAIPFAAKAMAGMLGETVGVVKSFSNFAGAAINATRAAGFLATAGFILQTALHGVGVALGTLLKGFGPVGLGITAIAVLMQVTGQDITDVMNTLIRVGGLLGAGLVQFFGTVAETIAKIHGTVANTAAGIARTMRDLVAGLPLVGGALAGELDKIQSNIQGYANVANQLSGDIRVKTDELSAAVINAANAALIQKKANEAAAEGLSELDIAAAEAIYEQKNFGSAVGEADAKVNPFRKNIKGLVDDLTGEGDGGGKGKSLKEETLSAAEAFEQFINSLSTTELAEFARQTDINRIAQEAWEKELTNWLRSGDIESVAQAFADIGKTGKEAFDFITAALKQIQAEGPRTSDEIVRAAKETRLLDDQWKFFESDAKRMIKAGLINEVAKQLIDMGKTGTEAIDFINKTLEELQEEAKEAAEEQKKLKEEFVKAGMAAEELAAKQRADHAAYMHNLKQEREELERKRLKEEELLAAKRRSLALNQQARWEAERDEARNEARANERVRLIQEQQQANIASNITTATGFARTGNWEQLWRSLLLISDLPGTMDSMSRAVINALQEALNQSGFDPRSVLGFQHGGTVPGQPSQGRMAYVHGSEAIIPASVRHMEFNLIEKLLSALGNMGNNFTVNANYQNTQSPASLSMDMAALIAMSRH